MAAVQPPLLDAAHLGRFFDAARLRLQILAAPKAPPAAPPRPAAAPARPAAAIRFKGPLVVPMPKENALYRRTFNVLLAHPETTDRYDDIIFKYARLHKLEPRLLKAIIAAESEFSTGALSPRGARGLMQVMPLTAEEMGVSRTLLSEPEANIRAGAAYLATLFRAAWKRYKLKGVAYEDAPLWIKQRIIAAYNAGPRFLYHNRWFTQTRHYVRKVLLFYKSRVTDFRRLPGAGGAFSVVSRDSASLALK